MQICDFNWPVSITQDINNGLFIVSYGAETKHNLTRDQAARYMGQSIMHSLTSESIIENTEEF